MIPSNPRTAFVVGLAVGLFVVPVVLRTAARKTR